MPVDVDLKVVGGVLIARLSGSIEGAGSRPEMDGILHQWSQFRRLGALPAQADGRTTAPDAGNGAKTRALGLAIDLSALTFLSSFGIGRLLVIKQAVEGAGGGFATAAATPEVLRILNALGIVKVMNHYPSMGEAMAAVRQQAAGVRHASA